MNKLPFPPENPSKGGSMVNSTKSSLCLNNGAMPSKVVGVEIEIVANSEEVKAGGGEVREVSAKTKTMKIG